eukprot:TRINITY_DN4335_c0_g1_i1.p1 TRINITY_DN4335_c0_g1~~TRINITY_DN4335_c0_g1_i1.p1  ORF type:complete len:133 (-),score=13.88 TRINITY_DN4335_c0_g1_i1:122-520(-)
MFHTARTETSCSTQKPPPPPDMSPKKPTWDSKKFRSVVRQRSKHKKTPKEGNQEINNVQPASLFPSKGNDEPMRKEVERSQTEITQMEQSLASCDTGDRKISDMPSSIKKPPTAPLRPPPFVNLTPWDHLLP